MTSVFAAPECRCSAGDSNTSLIRTKSDTSELGLKKTPEPELCLSQLKYQMLCLFSFFHPFVNQMYEETSNTSVVFQVKIQPINQNQHTLLLVRLALFIT